MTSVGSTLSYTHYHQQNEMAFHVIIGELKSHLAVYVQKSYAMVRFACMGAEKILRILFYNNCQQKKF